MVWHFAAALARVNDVACAISLGRDHELLHAIPQEYRVDQQAGINEPLGMTGMRLEAEVYLVTVYSNALQNLKKCVERAGYHVEEFVLEPLAASLPVLTPDELELLIQRRQTKLPLSSAQANTDIAGRPYQVRAIKAVGDAFDRKQREALLVMATGSGKTRTTIALVDLLQKASWVKRVLFLADRTALVHQAANAFKQHLPGSTTVNLVTEKAIEGRVYVSTYPTMMSSRPDRSRQPRRRRPRHR